MAEINRLVWEKGDFGAVAPMGWDVGEVVVGHVGVKRGERVVDVACGTGNAAIRAAQRGGTVTALDIVPALLDQGRALAAEAGVKVEFVEGDAEDLPPVSLEQHAAAAADQGVPGEFVELMTYLFRDVLDGRNAHLADGIQRALGREPRDFADYA